jgi:peptide/nickel transport system substrate-binding protein
VPQNFAAGEENFAVRNTNGTGPYQLVARPRSAHHHARLRGHWAPTPQVTEIIYTPIAEAATRVAALLSGEVDLVQDVPVQDIARLEQTAGVSVVTGPENRNIFFSYDMTSEPGASANVDDNPFAHAEIREAMALAIDRDAIRQVVMRGQSQPSAAPLPPFVNGWPKTCTLWRPIIARASRTGARHLSERLLGRSALPQRPLSERRGDLSGLSACWAGSG